eukprot:scaffold239345_cov24-Tisochrysis_lutea.AAC.1
MARLYRSSQPWIWTTLPVSLVPCSPSRLKYLVPPISIIHFVAENHAVCLLLWLCSDEALWPISRTQALEANLRTRELEVVVFDDAGGEDPMRSIVGVAHVPLEALSQ